MYKHILLAVDFDKEEGIVEQKAAQVQQMTGAKLSLIHIIEPIPAIYMGDGLMVPADYMVTEVDLEKRAKGMLDPISLRLGLPKSQVASPVYNDVSDGIVQYAIQNDVDLIVIGSHARHGFRRLLLGSTANSVLHHAECDVMTVRINE
ncbi:MAG: universal stress protein [Gammaproteobacteria bacterium]|nr:universal stress protein [Gammaproteobacteria bacterium]